MKQQLMTWQLAMVALWSLLPGCGCERVAHTGATAERLMVVNVLGAKEYEDAHIKGSVNVPFNEIEKKAKSWDKNIRLVLYCSNYFCMSSGEAVVKLRKLGFDAVAYEGGTAEWYTKGLPLVGAQTGGYLHTVGEPSHDESIPMVTADALKEEMANAESKGLLITDVNQAMAA